MLCECLPVTAAASEGADPPSWDASMVPVEWAPPITDCTAFGLWHAALPPSWTASIERNDWGSAAEKVRPNPRCSSVYNASKKPGPLSPAVPFFISVGTLRDAVHLCFWQKLKLRHTCHFLLSRRMPRLLDPERHRRATGTFTSIIKVWGLNFPT